MKKSNKLNHNKTKHLLDWIFKFVKQNAKYF